MSDATTREARRATDVGGEARDIYCTALELLRAGATGGLGLVTHVFGLEEYRAAFAAALDKGGSRSIKVAFRPNG